MDEAGLAEVGSLAGLKNLRLGYAEISDAALASLGKRSQAIRALRKVVRRAPGFAWAHYDLGKLLREDGDLTVASEHFARAAEVMTIAPPPSLMM